MSIQHLIDENLPPLYQEQLRLYLSELTVLMIGDPNTPSKGTLDPEILHWCEHNNFILVTNNRRSMPIHLTEHLDKNRGIPGIFVLRRKSTIGEIINDLVLISQIGNPSDYQNRITYIPL